MGKVVALVRRVSPVALLLPVAAFADGTDPSAAITTLSTWVTGTLEAIAIGFFGVMLVFMLGMKYTKRAANRA